MNYMQIEEIMKGWTAAHATAALAEGWDLFTTTDADSDVQVQRIDDPDELADGVVHLASDAAALALVYRGAGAHHAAAREIIKAHFPNEWISMQKAAKELETA